MIIRRQLPRPVKLTPDSRRALVALVLTAFITSCSDDIQSGDREEQNPPPETAGGFVGYSSSGDKLTSCGVCHVNRNGNWSGTAHADAYATLDESGSARDFCYGCHTVSENGNAAEGPAGWNAVQHIAYHDVQCESCHGPGSDHIEVPDGVSPLASLAVSTETGNGCGACHSGNHQPFVEEWSQSRHANVGFQASRDGCKDCHEGQARLTTWGVTANYVERQTGELLPIACGVCHDPHSNATQGQLRFPVLSQSRDDHLCSRCHDRDESPDLSDESPKTKPHAPETGLLFGTAGWFPPGAGFQPGEIRGTHGSAGNPTLCAGCHTDRFTVTDPESGDFVFSATGHLFRAIPCLDEQGIPTTEDCAFTTEARTYEACADGCHGTQENARQALDVASIRIDALASTLEGQLASVPPGEIDPNDGRYTVAEGATFNVNLARFKGRVQPSTTHNSFLLEALLTATIDAVEAEYGIAP